VRGVLGDQGVDALRGSAATGEQVLGELEELRQGMAEGSLLSAGVGVAGDPGDADAGVVAPLEGLRTRDPEVGAGPGAEDEPRSRGAGRTPPGLEDRSVPADLYGDAARVAWATIPVSTRRWVGSDGVCPRIALGDLLQEKG
jgi:hypothetical protein